MKTALTAVAVAAALASLFVALTHNGAPRMGMLAALACAALTALLMLTARELQAPNNLEEPRRTQPYAAVEENASPVSRGTAVRNAFAAMAGVTALLIFAPIVKLARGGVPRPKFWRRGVRLVTAGGKPVLASEVPVGGIVTVFPQSHAGYPESATVLLRVEEAVIEPAAGRETWHPGGALAYSKICTHAGCPVAIYREEAGELYCPCHQSVFDIRRAAHPRSGPATRALPQLPLRVDAEGYFVADGPMSGPIGPDDWSRPI